MRTRGIGGLVAFAAMLAATAWASGHEERTGSTESSGGTFRVSGGVAGTADPDQNVSSGGPFSMQGAARNVEHDPAPSGAATPGDLELVGVAAGNQAANCLCEVLFFDDFETGDTSRWSASS